MCHMRTTVDVPDAVMVRVKVHAAAVGASMRNYFVEALEEKLARTSHSRTRERKPFPVVGRTDGPPIAPLTREQIEEEVLGKAASI